MRQSRIPIHFFGNDMVTVPSLLSKDTILVAQIFSTIYAEIKTPIEFAAALGDASRPK